MIKYVVVKCVAVGALVVLGGIIPLPVLAQSDGVVPPEVAAKVYRAVARALIERASELLSAGDALNAKRLALEAIERDPAGPHRTSAQLIVKRANRILGLAPLAGLPAAVDSAQATPTPDALGPETGASKERSGGNRSAASAFGTEAGADASKARNAMKRRQTAADLGVRDPYKDVAVAVTSPVATRDASIDRGRPGTRTARDVRREITVFAGAYGLIFGSAFASDSDRVGGLALLGAGLGVGAAYWASHTHTISREAVVAFESAGTWGALAASFVGHVASGDASYTQPAWSRWTAVGGVLGMTGGYLWSRWAHPETDDIAFANSLALYGAATGLLLGLALPPAKSEAFSVNALVGGALGLAAGYRFRERFDGSRRRLWKIDAGAALGALAPLVLVYPFIHDNGTNNDEQVLGIVSMAGLVGGAYVAYRITSNEVTARRANVMQASPAFVRRDGSGDWRVGAPLPRPAYIPMLTAPPRKRSMIVDVFAGRW